MVMGKVAKIELPLDEKLLWNVQEVAAKLGCHPNTVWNRLKSGSIPSPIKWDGKTVWRRDDIIRYVDRLAG
jgi:predicted DNA-binding transcriptional regulator AlpA